MNSEITATNSVLRYVILPVLHSALEKIVIAWGLIPGEWDFLLVSRPKVALGQPYNSLQKITFLNYRMFISRFICKDTLVERSNLAHKILLCFRKTVLQRFNQTMDRYNDVFLSIQCYVSSQKQINYLQMSLNRFMLLFFFHTPWKHLWFSDVFREYRKRPVA